MISNEEFSQECRRLDGHTLTSLPMTSSHRSMILNWLMRLQERCRISDLSWFRAVALFDKVLTKIKEDQYQICNHLPHHIAAVCLYMMSKFNDPKYLVIEIFIKGFNLTEIKSGMMRLLDIYTHNKHFKEQMSLTHGKIIEIEIFVLEKVGFKINSIALPTIYDFFLIYFQCIETIYTHGQTVNDELQLQLEDLPPPRIALPASKSFGLYLCHMMTHYPTSLHQVFGAEILAAGCLKLTLRICGFPFG